jgi:hypothetical protein
MTGTGSEDAFHAFYESEPGSTMPEDVFPWQSSLRNAPDWDGPSPVLERALAIVQADLNAAGLKGDGFRLSYAQAGWAVEDDPVVNVQWRGTWTEESIDIHATDIPLAVVDIARHVTQGLIELEGIYLPTCPVHAIRAKAVLGDGHIAVWVCSKRGTTPHVLAPVGKLAELSAGLRRGTPLYLRLGDLGPP